MHIHTGKIDVVFNLLLYILKMKTVYIFIILQKEKPSER